MKLLDTTFLIDMVAGVKETERILNSKEMLLTTQINMYEFMRGLFLRNVSSEKVLEMMGLFETIKVLSLDEDAALKSAEISAQLMKNGEMIPDNDCFIAGITLSKKVPTIVTRNIKHFKRIKGLIIESY